MIKLRVSINKTIIPFRKSIDISYAFEVQDTNLHPENKDNNHPPKVVIQLIANNKYNTLSYKKLFCETSKDFIKNNYFLDNE